MASSDDERARWTLGAGAFDIGVDEHPELSLEVRWAPKRLGFLPARFAVRPVLGLATTADESFTKESFWIFGGFRHDWDFAPRWTLSTGFAVSLYERGDGKNLGGTVEFRSYIEIARHLDERLRLGLAYYHLSNAGIYHPNPGSESLLLTLSAPVGTSGR